MHIHVLQHVPFEGLGSIAAWAKAHQASVTTTPFFEAAAPLPEPASFDALIALGGPMSVNDQDSLPWLLAEQQLIRTCIEMRKPVLGICLGAQLMAAALGARVRAGAHREIGWFPIQACDGGPGTFRFPEQLEVFHWHGETFDLPDGAGLLATSAACRHQAFQIGPRALGLQFHLETTPDSADAIISHCRNELVPGPFVQDEAQLRAAPPERYAAINTLMAQVLDYLTRDAMGA
ncbi:type 1 glutamine amidotransferase [Corticibacter populi]|uniref:Type 1 glutamine amidotransferase n=1 Tax=Corticibacter populi TaxID=1550736 RepID=A0A3M6QRT3_9BURK|nr:type 1 glutamine amidotransferase [Corticibacter populi]RMX05755.1 type 1 glutamine amidotransferase [Corticibacter populi]RZS30944.1 GMP synthase-like glutamine amidotransferase [Corticibacter populi]